MGKQLVAWKELQQSMDRCTGQHFITEIKLEHAITLWKDIFLISVSGLGFGIVSGAFSLINVLADMVGPGTIGIHGDSKYFFLVSGRH